MKTYLSRPSYPNYTIVSRQPLTKNLGSGIPSVNALFSPITMAGKPAANPLPPDPVDRLRYADAAPCTMWVAAANDDWALSIGKRGASSQGVRPANLWP